MNYILYSFLFLFLAACTSAPKSPNKHEILYANTADSLVKYKKEIAENMQSTPMMDDYMKLSYDAFRSKHKMNDEQMDAFAKALEVTYGIAATFRAINENAALRSVERKTHPTSGDYSFNKDLPAAGTFENDTSAQVEILMDAFESDDQPAKLKK